MTPPGQNGLFVAIKRLKWSFANAYVAHHSEQPTKPAPPSFRRFNKPIHLLIAHSSRPLPLPVAARIFSLSSPSSWLSCYSTASIFVSTKPCRVCSVSWSRFERRIRSSPKKRRLCHCARRETLIFAHVCAWKRHPGDRCRAICGWEREEKCLIWGQRMNSACLSSADLSSINFCQLVFLPVCLSFFLIAHFASFLSAFLTFSLYFFLPISAPLSVCQSVWQSVLIRSYSLFFSFAPPHPPRPHSRLISFHELPDLNGFVSPTHDLSRPDVSDRRWQFSPLEDDVFGDFAVGIDVNPLVVITH